MVDFGYICPLMCDLKVFSNTEASPLTSSVVGAPPQSRKTHFPWKLALLSGCVLMGHHRFSWASGRPKKWPCSSRLPPPCLHSFTSMPGQNFHGSCQGVTMRGERLQWCSLKTNLLNVPSFPPLQPRLQSPTVLTGLLEAPTTPTVPLSLLTTPLLLPHLWSISYNWAFASAYKIMDLPLVEIWPLMLSLVPLSLL